MNAKQKIAEVIEHRKREAVEKNIRHKLMAIATTMGEPILMTSSWSFDAGDEQIGAAIYVDRQPFDTNFDEEDGLPTSDENAKTSILGWNFDALRYGANIQIVHKAHEGDLKAFCDGYIVFHESFGELISYVPFPLWEDRINHWAITAEKRLRQRKEQEDKIALEEQKSILDQAKAYLKKFWGLDFSSKDR